MSGLQSRYRFILELDKLKQVFRTNITGPDRKESTAEHCWSATMIVLTLMDELKKEFPEIDELKALKLTLIHDIVEIYAGDVLVYDAAARKEQEKVEAEALKKLVAVCPEFGQELQALWHEFEKNESLEAAIAKAADSICPIFQRLHAKQSYVSIQVTESKLIKTKFPRFEFSKTFTALFEQLKTDLLAEQLIMAD